MTNDDYTYMFGTQQIIFRWIIDEPTVQLVSEGAVILSFNMYINPDGLRILSLKDAKDIIDNLRANDNFGVIPMITQIKNLKAAASEWANGNGKGVQEIQKEAPKLNVEVYTGTSTLIDWILGVKIELPVNIVALLVNGEWAKVTLTIAGLDPIVNDEITEDDKIYLNSNRSMGKLEKLI